MINDHEERILALLAVAYRKMAGARLLGNIRRAARYWGEGENHLAAIEIALSGLPPLRDREDFARLYLGEKLLAEGLTPGELIKTCGLDPTALDFKKYNPDQPRVPAGNPDGGQWTSDSDETPGTTSSMRPGGLASTEAGGPSAAAVARIDPDVEFTSYTPVHGLPADAVVVTRPDGQTIADPDSPTKKLMAPPNADFHKVYAAGQSISSLGLPEQYSKARAAIAQGGIYDFQRDSITEKFYYDYIHAANYSAGVYMAGAGYSVPVTLLLAKLYALRNSSNYNAQDQLGWIRRGWSDGVAGIWK